MKKSALFTTGYSGHDPDSFISKLAQHNVMIVVDVRRKAISRKQGFSRTSLDARLQQAGVEYVHIRELGVPDDLRARLKAKAIELPTYLSEFEVHLDTQGGALDFLYFLAQRETCCLICVEQLAHECHRSIVAAAVARRNGKKVEVVHI